MKRIIVLSVLAIWASSAQSQNCVTVVGNLIQCTPTAPVTDWTAIVRQNNAATSPEADLARQQAELVRLQQELLRQQIAAAKAAAEK